ncbi:SGNH/GDSL hydrolase family protein [Massilia horti]|uniref:SGNH/GDSL hydrolase family protein n=1 Tax=Massilia horti TaxID=2562153 RepID=A0A4Y9T6I7_9BURK|nr:SGNH/GDSL hydrolase family protein [Massilia horti]TFW33610.1 SGNH/GDSL hydrolase family protein [Massilia horti]
MSRLMSRFFAFFKRMSVVRPGIANGVASRRIFLAVVLALAGLGGQVAPVGAQSRPPEIQHWVGTWGTAPAGPAVAAQMMTLNDATLRLIVRTSIGGNQARIRVSNELGATPLRIGSAHIALRDTAANIVAGSDRVLTFSGMQAMIVPPGAAVLSDPVDLNVPAMSELAVSLYLPGSVQASTSHGSAFQTNYVSQPGNFTGSVTLPVERTIMSWPFLTEVDVNSPGSAALVAFGDSITDGANTTLDTNRRWPDLLALRLHGASATADAKIANDRRGAGANGRLGMVNRGIGGNRLLRDPGEQPMFGKSTLARFDRDVLATAGVRHMIVLIGINDIGHPGTGTIPVSDMPTLGEMIAGYRQLIARAHAKGITVHGATLTPFEGTRFAGYYTPEKEALRVAVNNWIRTSGEFDSVIDFDAAVRDPDHPARMLAAYDSGDHLHPSDQGMQAMANAIPLALLAGSGQPWAGTRSR